MGDWKNVVGYEGHYMVSDQGEVMSVKRGKRLMKIFFNQKGYPRLTITKNGKMKQVFVHRLVAEAFIGTVKEGYSVNHIDGNKTNNHISNLEIISNSENIIHSCYVLGNQIKPVYMLDKSTLEPIKKFPSITRAKEETGIDEGSIHKVCKLKRNFAGGYSWIFEEDLNVENLSKKKDKIQYKFNFHCKQIKQINPETNEVLAIYDSATTAINQTGIRSIISCASGHSKTAGGYFWRYVE